MHKTSGRIDAHRSEAGGGYAGAGNMEGTSFAALVLLLVPAPQQGRREQALDDFKEFRTKVLVKNGQSVEFGQPMFRVNPA